MDGMGLLPHILVGFNGPVWGEVGWELGMMFVASRRVRLQSSLLMSCTVCPLIGISLTKQTFPLAVAEESAPEMQNSQG